MACALHPEWYDDEVIAMNGGVCRIPGVTEKYKGNPARAVSDDDRHLVQLWFQCTNEWGVVTRYPDGEPVLDQPIKLTRAFAIIGREVANQKKAR